MSIDYLDPGQPIVSGKVVLRIGGMEYFEDLQSQIQGLVAGDKLYLMNWHIAADFFFPYAIDQIQPSEESQILAPLLVDAVSRGVDVRVLLWVNSNLFEPLYPFDHNPEFVSQIEDAFLGAADIEQAVTDSRVIVPSIEDAIRSSALGLDDGVRRSNGAIAQRLFKGVMRLNLRTVHFWRGHPHAGTTPLANRIIINTLDSAIGGCHAKFALALINGPGGLRGRAFTGGIDFNRLRVSIPPYRPGDNFWHDIMAAVEGTPAIEQLFHYYRTLWNANVERKTTYNPTITSFEADGSIHVDCVPSGAEPIDDHTLDTGTTFTTHKLQSIFTLPNTFQLFGTAADPGIGEPEIDAYPDGHFSYRDALREAFAHAEFYIYVEDQAMQSLELFALMVDALKRSPSLRIIMLRGADPMDKSNPIGDKIVKRDRYDQLSDTEKERFILYEANYTIHSKLFLIDDTVCLVGSGGFFTRSLTEEIEHGIAYIEDANDSTQTLAQLRSELWTTHTGFDFSTPPYDDMLTSIEVWQNPPPSFGNNGEGGQLTLFDWESKTLTPFPNVITDIADLLNIDIPLADDIPPEYAPAHSEYTKYLAEQGEIFAHMLIFEWPYQSWFQPSTLPDGYAKPSIAADRIPINVGAQLALDGPASNVVTWAYVPASDIDATDAQPATHTGPELNVRFRSGGMKLIVATLAKGATGTEHKVPFVVQVLENSGPDWVDRYRKSTDVADLSDSFRTKLTGFLQTVRNAGVTASQIEILTTYRPPERAFLMAACYQIARRGTAPNEITAELPHIPISWMHYDAGGNPDPAASDAAAQAMFLAYGIGSSGAAYPSEHTRGEAIDMKIHINTAMVVSYGDNKAVIVASQKDLAPVAETFGIRLLNNSNHWSSTGR